MNLFQRLGAWMTVRRCVLAFFLFSTAIAGVGFSFKIVEFADDLTAQNGLQFAGAHLLTYAIVAVGFLALLLFSFLSGHFRDIEEPKNDLLEKERRYDERLPRLS
jgi:hypothetical protein